ncbi:Cof-type HAD-IIB family hydrolase [Paenibacillus antri]|uniref:Cof-type HAD-IIB family hydrolase n=1 Tax=Paenibacillus antri TaxID=2582848 RepID=A0A5R9GHQ0_9BACL|nr:Cof-type HAD-IIB family hydrolase [Paenibacillus antri]TLS52313.1 Cof-type HAD-IIB family hydrolase [Paenibacillus antri]
MIKLAAFDVDGTLRERDYLPDSTRTALRKLKEKGVALAICTGRSEFELVALREELGIDWAVSCNGSHIGYRGTTVAGTPFPKELIQSWLTLAEARGHEVLLYAADSMYLNRADAPRFRQAQSEIGFLEPTVLSAELRAAIPDIYQCIVYCEADEQGAYTSLAEGDLYVHRWRPWAVDFNPRGMNKAVGLKRLLEHLSLAPEEAAAFGDGLNDLEMMALVGSAIVMGNGCDELKALATFVTKSLHEDGIAHAVDHLERTAAI